MKKTIFGKKYTPTLSNNLLNGLTAFYKLDGNGNDELGNNNLSPTGITYGNAKINQGAVLDPNTSQPRLQGPVNSNVRIDESGFSCAFWVKFNTVPGQARWLVSRNVNPTNPSPSQRDFDISRYGTVMYFDIYAPGENPYLEVSYQASYHSVGEWIHVVCTYDGTHTTQGMKMFENGIEKNVSRGANHNFPHSAGDGYLVLGNQNFYPEFGNQYSLDGMMDEVGFWNRALSELEITSLYNLSTYPFN